MVIFPTNACLLLTGMNTFEASDMSIFWQIPQYCLIGIGEIFATVSALNVAVTEAPRAMHAIATAGFYLSAGLGSLFGILLLSLFNGSLLLYDKSDGINVRLPCSGNPQKFCRSSHFDYYFFILAGLGGLGAAVFLLLMRFVLPKSAGVRVDRPDSSIIGTAATNLEAES